MEKYPLSDSSKVALTVSRLRDQLEWGTAAIKRYEDMVASLKGTSAGDNTGAFVQIVLGELRSQMRAQQSMLELLEHK